MSRPSVAPYTKIVAELRARIENGTLAPGERLPSTREITRQWGVAMATATKVLTTLRHEGLVHAVAGVGTVVSSPETPTAPAPTAAATPTPRRRPIASEPLARERVVVAAMKIADAEGLASLSMRRVATELGVATMSLYRHVSDKDDLLLKMMDAAFRELPLPDNPPKGWRARVELAARMLWATFRRHPWLASAMSVTRPQLVASGMAYTEWVLAAFHEHGLDPSTALTAHIVLFTYVRGTAVNLELEAEAEAATGLSGEEWMDRQEPDLRSLIADGGFPALGRVLETPFDFDLDALFEFGLQRLLDGLAVLAEAHR